MYLRLNQKQISSTHTLHRRHIYSWIKSGSELKQLMKEINRKSQSIKYDFKSSKESLKFLETLVYIDSNKRLQTTLYKKPTDCQNYLLAKLTRNTTLSTS